MSIEDGSPREAPPEDSDAEGEPSLPLELLNSLPEDRREQFSRKFGKYFIQFRLEERYSGSLPPYQLATGWNDNVPGAAERIFDLYQQGEIKKMEANDRLLSNFEASVRHQMALEMQNHKDSVAMTKSVIKESSDKVRRGQWIGFVGAVLAGAGGIHLVYLGESAFGAAVLIAEALGFASIYVLGVRNNRNQFGRPDATAEKALPRSTQSAKEE